MAARTGSSEQEQGTGAAGSPSRQAAAQTIRAILDVLPQVSRVAPDGFSRQILLLALQFSPAASQHHSLDEQALSDALGFLANPAVAVLQRLEGERFKMSGSLASARDWIAALCELLTRDDDITVHTDTTSKESDDSLVPPRDRLAQLITHLEALGFSKVSQGENRYVKFASSGRKLGLSVRQSKHHEAGHWWWTFTRNGDALPLADCDRVILIGLMESEANPTLVREEVLFLPWSLAPQEAGTSRAWTDDGRLHLRLTRHGPRWIRLARRIDEIQASDVKVNPPT